MDKNEFPKGWDEQRVRRVLSFYEKEAMDDDLLEAQLLLKINQGIPKDLEQRYSELITKRQDANLTQDEYAELIRLTQQVEQIGTQRVEYLAELAQIRGVTLGALMENLGLHTPAYD